MVIEVSCHTGPYYDDKHVPERHVRGPHEHMYHNVLHVEPMDQSCNFHPSNIDPEPFNEREREIDRGKKNPNNFSSVTMGERKNPAQTEIAYQSVLYSTYLMMSRCWCRRYIIAIPK